jgi:hypothetical protein
LKPWEAACDVLHEEIDGFGSEMDAVLWLKKKTA